MVVLSYDFPVCEFKSENVTEAIACALLQIHAFTHAAASTAHHAIDAVLAHDRQEPKLDRPRIDLAFQCRNVSGTYSLVGSVLFQEGSRMSDESVPLQLFQYTSKELKDNLLKFNAEIATMPIEELTKSIRHFAVIPFATGVLRTKLMQMRQMRDDSFESFAVRLRGKAATCNFLANGNNLKLIYLSIYILCFCCYNIL